MDFLGLENTIVKTAMMSFSSQLKARSFV